MTFWTIFLSIIGIYLLTVAIAIGVNRYFLSKYERLPIFLCMMPAINVVIVAIIGFVELFSLVYSKIEPITEKFQKWYYEN